MTTAEMIKTGQQAPDFTLENQDSRQVRLGDFRGQWLVLYFYPKDDTPGCTTEACEFTANFRQFDTLRAVVVGVSPDSPESHRKFIEKHDLKHTLLSDPQHEVLERYGAWGEKNSYGKRSMGVLRSTLLIDPEGTIIHHWPKVTPAGHAEAVAQKIRELGGEG